MTSDFSSSFTLGDLQEAYKTIMREPDELDRFIPFRLGKIPVYYSEYLTEPVPRHELTYRGKPIHRRKKRLRKKLLRHVQTLRPSRMIYLVKGFGAVMHSAMEHEMVKLFTGI